MRKLLDGPLPRMLVPVALVFVLTGVTHAQPDPLPSWNDTAPKRTIVAFVKKVSTPGSPDFVPPAERIATFDNDGTLWAEQPMYFQAIFILDRIKQLAPQHPEWKDKEPFASVLKGDTKAALAGGERALLEMAMATHAGMTTEEFGQIVTAWLATAKHPKSGRPYTEMVYQPMLELLRYLRANGFKTFVVSGGGIEFVRPWAERVYGIPPEQVVGSSIKTKYEIHGSPSASTSTSAAARSWPSATPTAISRCWNGRRREPGRAWASSCTTPMPSANGRTTGIRLLAASFAVSTKGRDAAGPS